MRDGKVPKRTRERAAQLCSMAACSEMLLISCARHLGLGRRSAVRRLAMSALVRAVISNPGQVHRYAEAEAIIRTGWSP